MEKRNNYWLSEKRRCIFCGIGTNHMEYHVDKCQQINSWFRILDRDRKYRIDFRTKNQIWKNVRL